jgi:hypothetical protein
MRTGRPRRGGDDEARAERASTVSVGIVFVGLFIVTALLAGSFWVVATGGEDAGDPTKLAIDSALCSVSSDVNTTGVGTVTLSMRYRGNRTLDLSDATVEYADETVDATLAVGRTQNATAAALQNATGAYDRTIERGENLALVVPVEAVRGDPLPSGMRGTIDVVVDGATATTTGVRAPGGLSESKSFVNC